MPAFSLSVKGGVFTVINESIKKAADDYYSRIAINDFSSFIRSDFKDGVLIDLSYERACENIRLSDQFIQFLNKARESFPVNEDDNAVIDALLDFAGYIKTGGQYFHYKFNVTHNTCPLQYVIKRLETYPIRSDDDFSGYAALLSQLPAAVSDIRKKLAVQAEMGIYLPAEELEISIEMFESFLQDRGSLLNPANRGLSISRALLSEINLSIEKTNREIEEIIRFMKTHDGSNYRGIFTTDAGQEYYKSLIYTYTSYNIKPEEIYQIGLEQMEVTMGKMRRIIKSLGYQTDIAEFNSIIGGNPRFFDKSPEELENRFRGHLNRIRPLLNNFFIHLPKADCDIRALPISRAGSTSWGYYSVPVGEERKGIFYCSPAELDKRNQIRAAAITYHELLPGHHFQMNLIMEDESLPMILRYHFNTAFADGWAEYCSDLADEMGLYDEYDLYGRYLWDMMLCVRLVVDSGANGLGWELDRVRDFMRRHTIMTESEIHTESLRYTADMPGQALAYKMGSLKNHELRHMAENSLKEKFDIRKYHDWALRYGSVPLYVMESNINRYINSNTEAENGDYN